VPFTEWGQKSHGRENSGSMLFMACNIKIAQLPPMTWTLTSEYVDSRKYEQTVIWASGYRHLRTTVKFGTTHIGPITAY